MLNEQADAKPPDNDVGRQTISLDGLWDFSFEGLNSAVLGERLIVPGVWQVHFPALRNSSGTGTYRRNVDIPTLRDGQRLHLVFEGIFHIATVSIDGAAVAQHNNAWTPFEVDVTEHATNRRSLELTVTAQVPDDTAYGERGFSTMLHGKQDWYGLQGGIWKSVRLEIRESSHIKSIAVTARTDLSTHSVAIAAQLANVATGTIDVTVSREGQTVARQNLAVSGGGVDGRIDLPVVELWSPDRPCLYEVSTTLRVDGRIVDAAVRNVGFRRFETRDGRLYLNGAPFYMIGALDQDWYPEEDCRPPDRAFLEERFRNARQLGLNTLRCHVKIPDAAYFELCDRMGIIVWLDMPYMEFLAPETRAQLTETFEAAVANHGHHACICIWTIINEGWGIDLDDNPDDRVWLGDTFDRLKSLVPDSLLVDNSPCFPRNYHVKTEIEDFHWYNSSPSQDDQFEATTNAFAARAAWTFSPHGDAIRTGQEPLVVSEFGVWGLPHPSDVRDPDGNEPWWFESGHDWNNGAGLPHGIEARFRDAGFARTFGDLEGFVAAAQETQFRGLKHQIETLRYAEQISGYVITELNDTQWEANGLMDARNNVRAFGERLASLQSPWLVVARTERTALAPGERARVRVRLTGAAPAPRVTLSWHFAESFGQLDLLPAASGSAEALVTLTAPMRRSIEVIPLAIEAHDADGRLLSSNSLEFCIVPALAESPQLAPADAWSAHLLDQIRWPAVSEDASATLLATRLTRPVRQALLNGRRVLLIANDMLALTDPRQDRPERDLVNFPKMEIREREGTYWDGRWMGAFSWRRTDGAWSSLPNGPMLDRHWHGLLPRYVLTGFRSTAFAGLVDAGVTVAWIHKSAAFSKRSFLGKGWLTATTFDLSTETAQENPLAPHLLAALVQS